MSRTHAEDKPAFNGPSQATTSFGKCSRCRVNAATRQLRDFQVGIHWRQSAAPPYLVCRLHEDGSAPAHVFCDICWASEGAVIRGEITKILNNFFPVETVEPFGLSIEENAKATIGRSR